MVTSAGPSAGTSVRAASADLLDPAALSVSLQLLGSPALLFYRPDQEECARRARVSAARLDRLEVLQTLLELPVDEPVALAPLPAHLRAAVRRLPAGAAELDQRAVTRRAVRPLVIDLAVVRASAAGWRGGLERAGRFAPFCRRALLLERTPPVAEEMLMEAAFYGIGILVADGERVNMLLEPRPHAPLRHTPAAWCFTEEFHHRIC
ncbi:hypothetical protein ACFV0R_26790 [Streptomyces sp. NPDC059578]|uniref:hypothetical protein n=1 Tax=unclassified Streptomyces TaxID=2593676 RepID=UPI0036654AA9